eukprot:2927610-Pyramimonas_sp.AAC.1
MLEYETIGDYVAVQVFGLGTESGFMSSHKKKAVWPNNFNEGKPMLVFRENDFPYSLEDGVEHHVDQAPAYGCMWEQCVAHHNSFESIFFINPPEYKSVHNVHHAHVLSRKSFGMKHSARACPIYVMAGLFQSCTYK